MMPPARGRLYCSSAVFLIRPFFVAVTRKRSSNDSTRRIAVIFSSGWVSTTLASARPLAVRP